VTRGIIAQRILVDGLLDHPLEKNLSPKLTSFYLTTDW